MSLDLAMKGEHEQVQENEGKGKPIRQYIFSTISNIGLLCSGLTFGWSSPIQPKLEDPDQTPLDGIISSADMSWIASLILVTGIFFPFVAPLTVDRFGRKPTLIAACIIFTGGWLMVALANSVELIFVARFLQGTGMCVIFTANLIYVSEIATDEARGAITSMIHLSIVLGVLIMFSIGPFLSYQGVGYAGTGVSALYFVLLWFIPESPNYHVLKGDDESAKKSLMIIRGRTEQEVEPELQKIQIKLEAKMSEGKAKFSDLWMTKAHVMSLVLSCTLLAVQLLSGQSVVLFYMVSIFAAAESSIEPEIASIIVAAIQVSASLLVPFVVERLGRKILLIISLVGVAISLGVLGTYFYLLSIDEKSVEGLGWIPLLTLITFFILYCFGIGPLVWTIAGEVFPANIKTLATSIATSFNFAMGFLIIHIFNLIQDAAGAHAAFWTCCGVAVFGIIFVAVFLPETKQKTPQQIEDLLNK